MTDQPEALRVADALEDADNAGVTASLFKLCRVSTIEHAAEMLRDQHAEIERLRNDLSNIKFQAELVRDYVLQLNDDCDAAVKRCKP